MWAAVCLALPALAGAQAADNRAGGASSPVGHPGQLAPGPACGRDCAHTVLEMLGREVGLEQLDALLGHRSEVSLADLRRVLEAQGLHCQAILSSVRMDDVSMR